GPSSFVAVAAGARPAHAHRDRRRAGDLTPLPGVVLRRGAAAREDLVQLGQRLVVQLDLQGAHGAVELLQRARADDRRGDRRLLEQPGQPDVRGVLAQLVAELLVPLDLVAVLLQLREHAVGRRAALVDLTEHAAQQAARERAPGDDAQAVVLAGGQ